MLRAIEAGMASLGISEPNPSVGCVIVRDGEIISRGATEAHGGRHAERVAVDLLADKGSLRDSTLYVTLEPCSHFGRQPPCADFLVASGVRSCVIGALDPNPLVRGKGVARLREAGIRVEVSPAAEAAVFWHLPFILRYLETKPLVAAKWAQTADGKLAFDGPDTRRITNGRSRAYAHWLRKRYDAIMVGAGTVLEDFPRLDVRECAGENRRHPTRIIFDPRCRIGASPSATWDHLWSTTFAGGVPIVLLVGMKEFAMVERDRQGRFARASNIQVVQFEDPAANAAASLRVMLDKEALARYGGIESVLVEGGSRLLSLLLEAEIVDICHVFTGPRFGGGSRGSLSLHSGLGKQPRWVGVSGAFLGGDVLLEMVTPSLSELISQHVEATRSAVRSERQQ